MMVRVMGTLMLEIIPYYFLMVIMLELIKFSNPPLGTSDFTFSSKFLIYDSSLPGGSVLLCSETLDQFQFFIGNDGGNGYLDAFIGGDRTFADGITWQENVWYHFTVTRVGGLVTFYLNGEMLTQNESNSNINNVTYYDIGRRNNSAWNQFNGLLDDISIWSSGLSADYINQTLSSPLYGNESGLVGIGILMKGKVNYHLTVAEMGTTE